MFLCSVSPFVEIIEEIMNLDEEFLSIWLTHNAEHNTQHEKGILIVKSAGLSTKATVTDEGRL